MLISDSKAPVYDEIIRAIADAKVLKPDDVLILSLSAQSIFKVLYYSMTGRRIIYYLHEPQQITFDKFKKTDLKVFLKAVILNFVNYFIIAASTVVACDNKQVQFKLKNTYGFKKTTILPLLYEPKRYVKQKQQTITVGFIGRIDPKRPLPTIRKRSPFIEYHVLTSSTVSKKEQYQIVQKKYDDFEKNSFMNQASLICVANFNEYSQSSVVIECLYRKKPVIVSAFDPYKNLIQQIDVRCVVSSEEGIIELITDPDLIKSISKNWENSPLLDTFHEERLRYWKNTL